MTDPHRSAETITFTCHCCEGEGHQRNDEHELMEAPCWRCKGSGKIIDPVLPGRCPRPGGGHAFMYGYPTSGQVGCRQCKTLKADVPFIEIAGCSVEAHSDYGLSLQRQREEGGFHWRRDIYFKRLPDGSVRIRHPEQFNYNPSFKDWVIPAAEWASIVCSVSKLGETLDRWEASQDFHGKGS